MRLKRISIENFLSHAETHLNFSRDQLILVHGSNGVGKSAIFDAIEFALYGTHRVLSGSGTPVRTKFDMLVRNGETSGSIELDFTYARNEYRVTRSFNKNGNDGGQLWLLVNGQQLPIEGIGTGKQDVWTYVDSQLISADLFRSAIYLKQGSVDFFLSNGASDRIDRFKMLIDLTSYDKLWEKAKEARKIAMRSRELKLVQLNDIPNDTEENALQVSTALVETQQMLDTVTQNLSIAQTALEGAKAFEQHQTSLAEAKRRLYDINEILQDANEIRRAYETVEAWREVAETIDSYWRAIYRRDEADEKGERAHNDYVQYQSKEKELLKRASEIQTSKAEFLREKQALETEVTTLKTRLEVLQAEREAYEIDSDIERLQAEIDEILVSSVDQSELAAKRRLLSSLRDLVNDRRQEADLSQKLQEAEIQQKGIETEIVKLEKALSDSTRAAEKVKRIIQLVEEINEHKRVDEVGNFICPVCNQTLSDEAHEHLTIIVAKKQDEKLRLLAQVGIRKADEDYSQELTKINQNIRIIEQDLSIHRNDIIDRRDETAQARIQLKLTKERYAAVVEQIAQSSLSEYATQSLDWHDIYELEGELQQQEDELSAQQSSIEERKHQIARLNGKRESTKDTLVEGQPRDKKTIEQDELDCTQQLGPAQARFHELGQDISNSNEELQSITSGIETLTALKHKALEDVDEQENLAADYEGEAQELADQIDAVWEYLLLDWDAHEEKKHQVALLIEVAKKFPKISNALGQQEEINQEISRIKLAINEVPEEHRISVDNAEAYYQDLLEKKEKFSRQKEEFHSYLQTIKKYMERSTILEQEIRDDTEREEIFGKLSGLLKPDGPIQSQVVVATQKRICDKANRILEQLDDGLRLSLEDALSGRVQGKDIAISDERDPFSGTRYYEFLSGGEKFRVAVAVAMAIHTEVTHNNLPGTIIIDEGFGALDEQNRNSVARLIGEVAQGLVEENLVENIIITTHASDVKEYFPYQIQLEKIDGRVQVTETRI